MYRGQHKFDNELDFHEGAWSGHWAVQWTDLL